MHNFFILWKKELSGYFLSPVAYAASTFFLCVTGLTFYFLSGIYAAGVPGASLSSLVVGSPFYWMTQLVVIPLLTMRLFAEERRMGTLETLLTAPVSDAQVVAGKFAGVLTFYTLMWMSTLLFYVALAACSLEMPDLDPGILASVYLGVFCSGALFLGIGLMCSLTTSNQIIAAILCFTALIVILFTGFIGSATGSADLKNWLELISLDRHLRDFSRGIIDTRTLVFYAGGSMLCLFASTRMLESRQWK